MKHKTKITLQILVVSALLGSLPGCAELPLVVNASEAIGYAIFGSADAEIDNESISQMPYASLSAKIGSGPRSILVLGKKENGHEYWFSADQAVLVTKDGRLIQTAGFPENLKHTAFKGRDPVNRLLHLKKYGLANQALQSTRNIDVSMGNRFGIPVRSHYKTIGDREIQIRGIKIKTILVVENNTAFSINWSFNNYYWVDAFDGFIWKSKQHISRNFPPIDIEILKPAT
jgi:hypothetical protein